MIENNMTVTANGRTYKVEAVLGVGPNMAKMSPELTGQFGVTGARGSVAMLQTYRNGSARMIFTSSSKVENVMPGNLTVA